MSTDNVNHPFGDFCSLLSAAGYTTASGHEAGWRHKKADDWIWQGSVEEAKYIHEVLVRKKLRIEDNATNLARLSKTD